MPADIGGKSPLRDGSNEESILAEIKQISSLLQFKTCAPALYLYVVIKKYTNKLQSHAFLYTIEGMGFL